MNAMQRTRQQQACHIRFKQLQGEGIMPDGLTVYAYARQVLNVEVESLKDLNDWQLNMLRDHLEGKPTKIFSKLEDAARRAGIHDLAAWMRACSNSKALAWLKGYTPETLPINLQYRLVKMLERRQAVRA